METIIFDKKIEKNVKLKTPQDNIVSFSQYSKYLKCPRSWYLNYIEKIKISNESIELVFGQAMHTTVQHWLTILYTKTIKAATEFDFESFFMNELKTEYIVRKEKHGSHFSTPEELASYYNDGIQTLKYLIKKHSVYFSKKKMRLIAIEMPLLCEILPSHPTVKFNGFIDLIIYSEFDNKYYLIDLKTSTKGWNAYKKKDILTTDQLVLYKYYISKQFNIPLESIEIKYFILKKKIDEDSLWPQKRIQEFSPSDGSVSINRVRKNIEKYVSECFNRDGTYNVNRQYPAYSGVGERNCMFCIYDQSENCPKSNRISIDAK